MSTLIMRVAVHPVYVRADDRFRFEADCDGTFCGYIAAERKRLAGYTAWDVTSVRVFDDFQRNGVATKLYEAAAKKACARGGHLASTNRGVGSYSHAFWRKQLSKGRAIYLDGPRNGGAFILPGCPAPPLDGHR